MLPVILQQEAEHLAENLQPLAAGMAANASRDETSGQSDAA